MKTAEEILNEEFGESHTKNTWFHDSRIKAAMKAYAKQWLEEAHKTITREEELVSNSIDPFAHGIVEGTRKSRKVILNIINELK